MRVLYAIAGFAMGVVAGVFATGFVHFDEILEYDPSKFNE